MIKKQMILSVTVVFAIASLFLFTSCAKKQMTEEVTPPPPVKAAPPPKMEPEKPKVDMEAMKKAEEERQARLREMEMAQQLRDEIREFEAEKIYFDFDKSELKMDARAILAKKAEWLRKHPEFSLRIEGYCDERGTIEYNLALGERRANAAWKFLNALGISGSRMSTISYGEENPADPAHTPAAWAKNRRDEFKLDR
jgi:peptidoglycan-associated lipoprotein